MTTRQKLLKEKMGFITSKEEEESLIREDRLQSVLVRCGGGRFSCPVQDLNHFISIISRDGKDYIRDISVTR
jgi:hypothetical protein